MRSKIRKFFLWFRDHFLCWVEVYLRLHIGEEKKEKPIIREDGSKPIAESNETEKGDLK